MEDIHDQNSGAAWTVENDVGLMLEATVFVEGSPQVRTLCQKPECFFKGREIGVGLRRAEVLKRVAIDRLQLTIRTPRKPVTRHLV